MKESIYLQVALNSQPVPVSERWISVIHRLRETRPSPGSPVMCLATAYATPQTHPGVKHLGEGFAKTFSATLAVSQPWVAIRGCGGEFAPFS